MTKIHVDKQKRSYFTFQIKESKSSRDLKKILSISDLGILLSTNIQCYTLRQQQSTSATVAVDISRVTSPITVTTLFVTVRTIHTVTTTVVDTIISIRPIITNYNTK